MRTLCDSVIVAQTVFDCIYLYLFMHFRCLQCKATFVYIISIVKLFFFVYGRVLLIDILPTYIAIQLEFDGHLCAGIVAQ